MSQYDRRNLDKEGACLQNRRDFLRTGAALTVVGLLTTGCLPVIAVLLRGGLGRILLRGAGAGRTASLLTAGRGVSVGSRFATAMGTRMATTRILAMDRRVLATAVRKDGGIAVERGSERVFFSRPEPTGLLHYDYTGRFVGRTEFASDKRLDYVSAESYGGRLSGYDLLSGARLIRHFGPDGSELGQSECAVEGNEVGVAAGLGTEEYFDELFADPTFSCGEANQEYRKFRAVQRRCAEGDVDACEQVRFDAMRFNSALGHCEGK